MSYLDHIKSVFLSLGDLFSVKAVGAAALATYAFLFDVNLKVAMLSLLSLMVIDLVTGMIAASMKHGPGISSRGAAKTPLKFGVYCMLVSAAHLTDMAVFGGIYLEQSMIAFLAVTELISIIENAGKMGFAVPQNILDKLHDFRNDKTRVVLEEARTALSPGAPGAKNDK